MFIVLSPLAPRPQSSSRLPLTSLAGLVLDRFGLPLSRQTVAGQANPYTSLKLDSLSQANLTQDNVCWSKELTQLLYSTFTPKGQHSRRLILASLAGLVLDSFGHPLHSLAFPGQPSLTQVPLAQ